MAKLNSPESLAKSLVTVAKCRLALTQGAKPQQIFLFWSIVFTQGVKISTMLTTLTTNDKVIIFANVNDLLMKNISHASNSDKIQTYLNTKVNITVKRCFRLFLMPKELMLLAML
jgi:hypothetical protein